MTHPGESVATVAATVTVDRADLAFLLDRVVYGGLLPNWTPDRIEDLEPDLLDTMARCLRAIEAAEAHDRGETARVMAGK